MDPSKFWYKVGFNTVMFNAATVSLYNPHGWVHSFQGEIGFFDFYIIPLAKKLKECGVFGVSSVEYLDYATKNRKVRKAMQLAIGFHDFVTHPLLHLPFIVDIMIKLILSQEWELKGRQVVAEYMEKISEVGTK